MGISPLSSLQRRSSRSPYNESLKLSSLFGAGEECSAIDLVGGDGNFVLLLDASPASLLWKTAADRMVRFTDPARDLYLNFHN